MKELIKTVPNIRALAKRTFPASEKAQNIFTLEHVTKAAARLGHADPESDAMDAIEAHDESLEMPLDQESDEPEANEPNESANQPNHSANQPRARKTSEKSSKKKRG